VLPNIIKTVGDVTVGIFGMTTPEVDQLGTAVPISVSDDLLNIAAAQVAQLQAAGCQVIIMLSHLGYFDDFRVGTNVAGINLIIGGHDHYVFSEASEISNTSGGKAWIVQAGAFYRAMGKARLKVDQGTVTLDSYTLITLDQGVEELEAVKTAVTDMYAMLDAAVGGLLYTTVGLATDELSEWIRDCPIDGILDTHVGNICADAYVAATGADFAIQPGGSTAQPIYPGPIKALDLFRTIGYGINDENGIGFRVVTVDMTGEAVKAAVEATLMFIEANDEMLLHPSDGVTITFNPAAMAGNRLISLQINAAPIGDAATYTVALNELLLMYLDVLNSIDPRIAYTNKQTFTSSMGAGPLTELEALVGYVSALQTISPDPLPGRVVSEVTPVDPVAGVSESPILEANYPNPFAELTAVRFTLPARCTPVSRSMTWSDAKSPCSPSATSPRARTACSSAPMDFRPVCTSAAFSPAARSGPSACCTRGNGLPKNEIAAPDLFPGR
jgi:2',3'-cyclic-nucleotide 2'-phosphodiesterase (5'-nucleotidase family)